MGKRFYFILLSVLCLSLLLLGFSYSKTSGLNDGNSLFEISDDNFRVVYSNNKIDTRDNNQLDISVINKNEEDSVYFLRLEENSNSYQDVFYTIDGGDKMLLNNGIIPLGTLAGYGENGDFIKHTINLYSDKMVEFSLDIKSSLNNELKKEILNNKDTYFDNNDLRFYGEYVDNYVSYNGSIYRIIGIIDNKIRIIGNPMNVVSFNSSIGTYLSKKDYLASFNQYNVVNEDNSNQYKSWLNNSKDFWLAEETLNGAYYVSEGKIRLGDKLEYLYLRNVIELENNIKVIKGKGSLEEPYEVTYESK